MNIKAFFPTQVIRLLKLWVKVKKEPLTSSSDYLSNLTLYWDLSMLTFIRCYPLYLSLDKHSPIIPFLIHIVSLDIWSSECPLYMSLGFFTCISNYTFPPVSIVLSEWDFIVLTLKYMCPLVNLCPKNHNNQYLLSIYYVPGTTRYFTCISCSPHSYPECTHSSWTE